MNYTSYTSVLLAIASLIARIRATRPACNTSFVSEIPTQLFSGTFTNVYGQFCNEVNRYSGHQPISWTVNTVGDVLANNLPRRSHPSSNTSVHQSHPESFYGYTINLSYNPTRKGVSCVPHLACTEVFEIIASTCGHSGPDENLMAYRGNFGSGCGLYMYDITPPMNAISERFCYPLDYFGAHHKKVQDWVLDRLIREKVCTPDRLRVQGGDNSTWLLDKVFRINSVPYVFQVYWLDGCYQKVMDVDFNYPIEGQFDVNCTSLLWDDYMWCLQNDGVGGNITVGCVVYEYKTLDQRVDGNKRVRKSVQRFDAQAGTK